MPFWLTKLTSDVRYSDDTDPDKFRFGYCVAELVWADPGAQPDPAGLRYYIAPQPRTMALSRIIVGEDDEFVAFESLAVSPPQPSDFTRTYPMRGPVEKGPRCDADIVLLPAAEVDSILAYLKRDARAGGSGAAAAGGELSSPGDSDDDENDVSG